MAQSESGQKTLEMRVADLEDKLTKLQTPTSQQISAGCILCYYCYYCYYCSRCWTECTGCGPCAGGCQVANPSPQQSAMFGRFGM